MSEEEAGGGEGEGEGGWELFKNENPHIGEWWEIIEGKKHRDAAFGGIPSGASRPPHWGCVPCV